MKLIADCSVFPITAITLRSRRFENADVRQIPVAFGEVQPVANHELIRNLKAHVISLDGSCTARGFIQQRSDLKRPWLMRAKVFAQESQRQAGIKNVFHQDYIYIAQRSGYVFDQLHFTGSFLLGAVAAHSNEVKRGVQLNLPCQVAQKKTRAFQHANQHHRFAGKIPADLFPHAGHSFGNLFAAEKDFHRHGFRIWCLEKMDCNTAVLSRRRSCGITTPSKTSLPRQVAETAFPLPETPWNARSAGCRASSPDASDAASHDRPDIQSHSAVRVAGQKSYSPRWYCVPDRSGPGCNASVRCSTSSADGPSARGRSAGSGPQKFLPGDSARRKLRQSACVRASGGSGAPSQ